MSDYLHRFIFEDFDIRGEIISLEQSYQAILNNGNYPAPINNLLGEFLAAAGLLSTMLKFDGILTLQARGQGPLSLIMADCTRHQNLRAIAQLDNSELNTAIDIATLPLQELISKGTLAITISPIKGERYQGIVPLESDRLEACLENYFMQSEQLPSRLWLTANGARASGLLLQALPSQKHTSPQQNQAYWEHVTSLASTITHEEQLTLDPAEQLHRLFHQEKVRLFEPQDMAFNCSCSRERISSTLRSMGRKEVQSIIEEQGCVEIDCHFCHQKYHFTIQDVAQLFDPEPPIIH